MQGLPAGRNPNEIHVCGVICGVIVAYSEDAARARPSSCTDSRRNSCIVNSSRLAPWADALRWLCACSSVLGCVACSRRLLVQLRRGMALCESVWLPRRLQQLFVPCGLHQGRPRVLAHCHRYSAHVHGMRAASLVLLGALAQGSLLAQRICPHGAFRKFAQPFANGTKKARTRNPPLRVVFWLISG